MPIIRLTKEQELVVMEQVLADISFLAKKAVQKKWVECCKYLKPNLEIKVRFLRKEIQRPFCH